MLGWCSSKRFHRSREPRLHARGVQPELCDLVQDGAFTGNRRWHNDIKRGDSVAGDNQHMVVVDIINVADFAAV